MLLNLDLEDNSLATPALTPQTELLVAVVKDENS